MAEQEKVVKLEDIPQKQLKDLLEFPCDFTFKVVGANRPDLADDVIAVVQKYAKGDYNPRENVSGKGTYNPFQWILWLKILSKWKPFIANLPKLTA